MAWYGFRPYVPVAKRRAQARSKMDALRKKGVDIQPVEIQGRKIARTFWGEAWCEHLESFSDYANRLPRGRTYVRNGSVCHLEIDRGEIRAKVAGSEIYNIRIQIETLPGKKWTAVKSRCAGQVGSLLELLQGRLSKHVMQVVTDRGQGLFPLPREISLGCDCPDWAVMCKHVAAVLYGVGARLDEHPDLLFQLRGVDHEELIAADADAAVSAATSRSKSRRIDNAELSDVFGIDLEADEDPAPARATKKKSAKKKSAKKKSAKKTGKSKASKPAAGNRAAKKVTRKRAAKKKAATKKSASKPLAGTRSSGKASAKKKFAKKKTVSKKSAKKKSAKKKSTTNTRGASAKKKSARKRASA